MGAVAEQGWGHSFLDVLGNAMGTRKLRPSAGSLGGQGHPDSRGPRMALALGRTVSKCSKETVGKPVLPCTWGQRGIANIYPVCTRQSALRPVLQALF